MRGGLAALPRSRSSDRGGRSPAVSRRLCLLGRRPSGTLSIVAIDTLSNEAFDFASDSRFRAADVRCGGYDQQTHVVTVSVSRLTPELANPLITGFGTDSVGVHVEPNPHAETGISWPGR